MSAPHPDLPDIGKTLRRILALRGRVESQHQMLSEITRVVRPQRAGQVLRLEVPRGGR